MGHKGTRVNQAFRGQGWLSRPFPVWREFANVMNESRYRIHLFRQRMNQRMALDAYASCPCGSGKKFKWCCQPIHVDIDRAYRQDAEGQHEAALKIMADLVAAHPSNPEAWGRQAHLLYQNNKVEEAEKALDKAFECNPEYPFGLFLRGIFRYQEGEIAGAVYLLRKAAEAYDPEVREALGQVYGTIADCELNIAGPLAIQTGRVPTRPSWCN